MPLSFEDIPIEGSPQKAPIRFEDIPVETTAEPAASAPIRFEDIPVATPGKPSFSDYVMGLPQAAARVFNTTVIGGIVKPMAEMGEKITTLGGLIPRKGPAVSEILQPYAEQPKTDLETKTGVDVTTPILNLEPTATRTGLRKLTQALGIDPKSKSGQAIIEGTGTLGDILSSFTTPGNLALILTGLGFPKLAQPMAAAFVPGMAQGSAQGFREAAQGVSEGDVGKIARGTVGGVTQGIMGAGAGRYALSPEMPFGPVSQPSQVKFEDIPVEETAKVAPESTISKEPSPIPTQPALVAARPEPGRTAGLNSGQKGVGITPDHAAELQALRSEIATAEPGKRIFNTQEGAGGTPVVTGAGSTFPIKDLGPKATQLQVIDKVLAGKSLTKLQSTIYDRMREHIAKQKEDFQYRQEQNPVPMTTGDLNLKVGDEVKVPGDKLRVTKVADDGITLKDGITMKVDPVFDQIPVVGGEDGVLRAPDRGKTIATEASLAQKAGVTDDQMLAIASDSTKAENLRSLADGVSRGTLSEESAVSEIKKLNGSGNPPTPPSTPGGELPPLGNKFASRVFERLQEEHPSELQGEVTYERKNMKQDAEKAADLVVSDKKKAYRVAMGAEDAPLGKDGLPVQTSTGVNIAMAEKALDEGNNELYAQLVKKRSLDQTRRGQEIVAEKGSVSDNSTARYVKELIKARMDKVGKTFLSGLDPSDLFTKDKGSARSQKVTKIIDREVAKVSQHLKGKALDFAEAQALIDRLACK